MVYFKNLLQKSKLYVYSNLNLFELRNYEQAQIKNKWEIEFNQIPLLIIIS